jgi:hypothetical protein
VNNSPLPSPADRLTDLSHQLSEGAEAWETDNQGRWLVAPLIAMIAAFIKEIAESLAQLAALIRDGKLVPVPPAAPRQGSSRPAGTPSQRATPSAWTEWPAAAAAAEQNVPLAEPETAAPAGQESQTARPTSRNPRIARSAAPKAAKPAAKPQPARQTPKASPLCGILSAHWSGVQPKSKKARYKPDPWHALNVPISK